mmetsp:Transcript_30346/g.70917  ORF Transcript_30346/g.70917 Transcript_30346/m.70917 type:complete len:131 (+) Transcript_30346:633-1025(+)
MRALMEWKFMVPSKQHCTSRMRLSSNLQDHPSGSVHSLTLFLFTLFPHCTFSPSGYLIDQFMCATSNKRESGRYAGTSLETRAQFLKDVLTEVCDEVGADRVGLRVSPNNSYNDMFRGEDAPKEIKYIAG